jgi:hypothetical protein
MSNGTTLLCKCGHDVNEHHPYPFAPSCMRCDCPRFEQKLEVNEVHHSSKTKFYRRIQVVGNGTGGR